MSNQRDLLAIALALLVAGCKDVSRFSTVPGESYCGQIVNAAIVRAGLLEGVKMRFTFDADHVGDRPGALSTSDGLFVDAAMRPIPQLSHDPLFTFDFGEGRDKNLLYAVDPNSADGGPTVMVVLSFMHTGEAEVRLFRGAPSLGETGAPSPGDGAPIFAVFAPMVREVGTCSF